MFSISIVHELGSSDTIFFAEFLTKVELMWTMAEEVCTDFRMLVEAVANTCKINALEFQKPSLCSFSI